MLSKKIEIFGQQPGFRGGSCGGTTNEMKVDRKFPEDILQGRITAFDWTRFCGDVDKALIPANRFQLGCWGKLDCVAKVFFALGVIGLIVRLGNDDPLLPLLGLMVIPVVYFLVKWWLLYLAWENTAKKLRRVCHEHSENKPAVNFHLRQERHYTGCRGKDVTYFVECNVNDDEFPEIMEQGSSLVVPVEATPVFDPVDVTTSKTDLSPAVEGLKVERTKNDRILDLNRMIDILTEEEYNSVIDRIENDTSNYAIPIPVDQMEELERQRARLSNEAYTNQRKDILDNM